MTAEPRFALFSRRAGELCPLTDEDGTVWAFVAPDLAGKVAGRTSERLGYERVYVVPAWRSGLPARVRTPEELPPGELVDLIEELPARLSQAHAAREGV